MSVLVYLGCLAFLVCFVAGRGTVYFSDEGEYELPSHIQLEFIKAALTDEATGLLKWFDRSYLRHPDFTNATRIWWHALAAVHDDYFEEKPIRKEVRQMTDRDWKRYVDAIQVMTNTFPDPENPHLSAYGILLSYHTFTEAPCAHFGSGFLTWHREYLVRFEYLIRTLDKVQDEYPLAIPYADLTLDNRLPVPHDSVLWTEHFFGNNDGLVVTGPFAGIPTSEACLEDSNGSLPLNLYRDRNETRRVGLWSDTDAQHIVLSKTRHGDLVCNARDHCGLEGKHGGIHWFVGGHMGNVVCSPTDPIFYSHHAYVDCLWEEFRMNSQSVDPETDYASAEDGFNTGSPEGAHEPYALMYPFEPLRNIDGVSHFYRDHLFTCAPRPSSIQCSRHSDCGRRKFMWCNSESKCVSKVREGGVCGYEGEDRERKRYNVRCACFGRNMKGQCRKDDTDGMLRCTCEEIEHEVEQYR